MLRLKKSLGRLIPTDRRQRLAPVLDKSLRDLLRGIPDNQPFIVGERDDRIRRCLYGLDQLSIDVDSRSICSGDKNHGVLFLRSKIFPAPGDRHAQI